MTKKVWITIAAVVVLGVVGVTYAMIKLTNSTQTSEKTANQSVTPTATQEASPSPTSSLSTPEPSKTPSTAIEVAYSTTEAIKQYGQDGHRTVIFFAALAWCEECQATEADLKKNISKLPSDLVIVRANYDTERELKKQYAITHQDIMVQVDKDGKEITRWATGGSGTASFRHLKPL